MVKILLHDNVHDNVHILIALNLKLEAKATAAQYHQKLAIFFLYAVKTFLDLYIQISEPLL